MTKIADHVNPGDLVSASLINTLLDAVGSLDDRVTALQGSSATGAVVITQLIPPGPVQVGQELRILGQNFGFSVGAQRVFIDATPVNAFKPGSSDQLLIFDIPTTITDVPAGGRPATLKVSNQTTIAQQPITLLSAFTLQGSLDVIYLGVTPATIAAGGQATFQYQLRSRTNLDANYIIQPAVTGPANPLPWNSSLKILNASQGPVASNTIPLAAGAQAIFYVQISTVPSDGSTSFTLTVNANATGGNVSGSSGSQNFPVGTPAPQPDTTISLTFSSAQVTGTGSVVASTISLKAGSKATITLLVTFTQAGTYALSPVVSGANWDAKVNIMTTPTTYNVTAADLLASQGKVSHVPDFVVTANAGASASGSVQFQIQRQGASSLASYPMTLAAL